ncbi:hypothetical protein AQUSIP_02230 [Aquicella siphonis]|uniref:SH3b1 domain-containing protein n=1 Tax=Aquicella siphonis TaxID=254247 RepID=A0A5E4PDF4_9COXI|nr:SH3 domain-containing C40 family peptidase [Aquicella siphonis]VVC74949.1 hypothetical protein AQUSIP_02230 [Aquicella siphonis]
MFTVKRFFIRSALLSILASHALANEELISVFPLERYDQSVARWVKPGNADYDSPLLSAETQRKRMEIYENHWFGAQSPWNEAYVTKILRQAAPDDLKSTELELIKMFGNQGKSDEQRGYAENFRPHTQEWIENISDNIQPARLDNLSYQTDRRAIAVDNLHARVLPTEDVHFYSHQLAGQGYPFDNLQMSALWAGTPLYVAAETKDHAWSLVITPDYIAWVKSNGIARTDDSFINTWCAAAKRHLAAITRTRASVRDTNGQYHFSAYVGSVFPASDTPAGIKIMVAAADADRRAVIKHAVLEQGDAAMMPLAASPRHFAQIMRTMINRPYGWGSMYFYNDCSAELKSLFTPFGIWLPRHSSAQVTEGKMVDMSGVSPEQRLSYLMANGKKFLTLIYIGGHVILYIGSFSDPNSGNQNVMAMTYQNIWGLSPSPATRRAVIGESVVFPLLQRYPEDLSLVPLTAKKYFQVSYLDQWPLDSASQRTSRVNLKDLMHPEERMK